MKKITIKLITVGSFVLFIYANAFAQNTSATTSRDTTASREDSVKKSTKLDATNVPKKVHDKFYKEYPLVTYEYWYGYPTLNDLDWYYYDPLLYTRLYPENYVVEYTEDSIPYRSVYSKNGKKISTHKTSTADLPADITAAIEKTKYKGWTIEKEKEEIYKDTNTDKTKVYKVTVENGSEKHVLYIRSDGTLLKDKQVS